MSAYIRTPFIYFLAIAASLGVTGTSLGQNGQTKYVQEAAARLAPLVDKAAQQNYRFQKNAFSFGGALIDKNADRWVPVYTVQLTEGRSYVFLAAGDDDTRDLDLDIQDSSGRTLAADVETTAVAFVSFTPRTTGRYTVRLRLYDSRDGVPCYCLSAVMAKN